MQPVCEKFSKLSSRNNIRFNHYGDFLLTRNTSGFQVNMLYLHNNECSFSEKTSTAIFLLISRAPLFKFIVKKSESSNHYHDFNPATDLEKLDLPTFRAKEI